MMRNMMILLTACVVGLSIPVVTQAEVRTPAVFGDHMVLQRERPLRLWGWADPGEEVQVQLAERTASTRADEQGRWLVVLEPMPAGGPITLEVRGENTLRFEDVLVGEVWLASGQSNMEFPLIRARESEREIADAEHPEIRLFTVSKAIARSPQDDVTGSWTVCLPETAGSFSAVAYFFGRTLHQELEVPIGLVHSSWGGTPAQAWTSREALVAHPSLKRAVDELDERLSSPEAQAAAEQALEAWELANLAVDQGNEGYGKGFAEPELDDGSWQEMKLPTPWEQAGLALDGAVWFRRHFIIPKAWSGKELELLLGPIDDYDVTYYNGVQVGSTGRDTPGAWTVPRTYRVPGELVKPGPTVIAVRVFDRGGDGGVVGTPAQLVLKPVLCDTAPIALAGTWLFKVEQAVGPLSPDWGSQPPAVFDQSSPSSLYNAMIAPLIDLTIRGAIWYQGESDEAQAYRYRLLFPVMIRDWRDRFGLGDFPFYFVQLANYMQRLPQPGPSRWAEVREAQLWTLALPDTGMAVAIDIGEADDIHPTNKQEVGRRLALWALSQTYGSTIPSSGPLFRSAMVEMGRIRVAFDHATGLATADGGALRGFAVAGADRQFVWADAAIDGETVLVSAEQVPRPVAVRYDWADNPDGNLVNDAALPASPFRSDDWPGLTWGE